MYDADGNLKEEYDDEILHKRVMNNVLSGTVNKAMKSIDAEKRKKMSEAQKSTDLYPVDLEIKISGIGGIFPGNVFHVSYMPDRFRNFCVFQVMSVGQVVSGGTWETTITGQLRVAAGAILDTTDFAPELITKADAKIAEDSNLAEGGGGEGEATYPSGPSAKASDYDGDNEVWPGQSQMEQLEE